MFTNTFYKKGYLIAVYNQHDQLVAICDNVDEFADMFNKPKNTAKTIIHKIAEKKQTHFFTNTGEKLTVVLIPLAAEEIRELLSEKAVTI